MGDYYDKDGKPMDLMQWSSIFKDQGYRRIGSDLIDGVQVSTVWLGIDHRFAGEGPPIIFETMVFGGDDDEFTKRYCTQAEAEAGHREIVETLRRGERLL